MPRLLFWAVRGASFEKGAIIFMHDSSNQALIKKAYTYGYPIVGMYELLHSQVLDTAKATTGWNEFSHTASVASPKTSFIPAPNNDTSYSRAWLDLRKEPVLIETPDTHDRYYSIQLLDLFSETITNIGRRLNGTHPQTFAVIGPDWNGILPKGVSAIRCNTTFAIAFLRVLIYGEQDLEEVRRIQNGFLIRPLNGDTPVSASELPPYNISNSLHFFETLNHVLSLTPMLKQDAPILRELDSLGIGAGGSLHPLRKMPTSELDAICADARQEIDRGGLQFGDEVNHWRIAREGIGNYADDYFQRAVVWHKGALANQPQESLYPSTFQDADGEFLDGSQRYTLHFLKDQLPPVSQFWSLTMYRFSDALLVENRLDRYSIGDRTPGLVYDQDGGLTLYLQSEPPAVPEQWTNWLPAPKDQFFVTLRLYGPKEVAISGAWEPPAVHRCDGGEAL